MPVVYIHGVNVRNTKAYRTRVGLRRRMFKKLVIQPLKDDLPDLTLADEIFWGDQGAKYHWQLRSVPTTNVLEDLGAADDNELAEELGNHRDLLELLAAEDMSQRADTSGLEALGGRDDALLVSAADKDASKTVNAILTGERHALMDEVAADDDPNTHVVSDADARAAEREGEQTADLLLALGRTEVPVDLDQASTDAELLARVHSEVGKNYDHLSTPAALEGLGVGDWLTGRLKGFGDGVKRVVKLARRPKDAAFRIATLAVLSKGKDPALEQAKYFLGDVFEYAVRGRDEQAPLSEGVEQALMRVSARRTEKDPLVVVTHSFGGAVFYDLVTSDRFTDTVDLWVGVGTQVSFFAEMRFFKKSPDPSIMPAGDPENNRLPKPDSILKWINVYDPADVLSFVHERVFDEVKDIKIRDGANLANAHGAYFGSADFYGAIRGALEEMS